MAAAVYVGAFRVSLQVGDHEGESMLESQRVQCLFRARSAVRGENVEEWVEVLFVRGVKLKVHLPFHHVTPVGESLENACWLWGRQLQLHRVQELSLD